ncbi:MAG: hypothetical protein ACOCXJ_03990 [Planctomycetota bacterium]
MADEPAREYILYACPTGRLAQQIEAFLADSAAACGANSAHRYMPHCTLTGFFHDPGPAAPYCDACRAALGEHPLPAGPIARIDSFRFDQGFHRLVVDAPWLEDLSAAFAAQAAVPSRVDAIRVKSDLHISLAYGFEASSHRALMQLALEHIDLQAPVDWELRLYERHDAGLPQYQPDAWTCHVEQVLQATRQTSC